MALNFPLNPYSGQVYTADNLITYIFDGVKWVGAAANSNYQTGPLKILDQTISTSTDTGALVVTGGVGIGGDVSIGGSLSINGSNSFVTSILAGTGTTVYSSGGVVTIAATGGNSTGTDKIFAISNPTKSTGTTTGALTVVGGAGIGQNLSVGGVLTIGTSSLDSANLSLLISLASNVVLDNAGTAGNLILTLGVESTNPYSGDLVTYGGVGVGKSINVGRYVRGNTGSFNTLFLNGNEILSTGLTFNTSTLVARATTATYASTSTYAAVAYSLIGGSGGGGAGVTALSSLTDVVITGTPSDGQVLKYSSGTGKWGNDTDATGGASGLSSRVSRSTSSVVISANASSNLEITGYKSYALMSVGVNTSSWVTIYTSSATRAADASRIQGVDPTPGAGVLAEIITTGSTTLSISPATLGYNDDVSPGSTIYIKAVNLWVTSTAITVTAKILQLEA